MVVTHHQYGISALVSQTSFRGETSSGVAKCRLFSQFTERGACSSWKRLVIVVQLVKPHLIILEFSERRVGETQFKSSDSYKSCTTA